MELLEGEPLSEHLKRGPLSVDQAVPIATEMLAALGAIHAAASSIAISSRRTCFSLGMASSCWISDWRGPK